MVMDRIDELLENAIEEAMNLYDYERAADIADHVRKRVSEAGYVFYQP
jgi:hypothetical protein